MEKRGNSSIGMVLCSLATFQMASLKEKEAANMPMVMRTKADGKPRTPWLWQYDQKDGSVYSGIWEFGTLKQRSYETETLVNLTKEQARTKTDDETRIFAVIVGVATYNHMASLRYTDDDAYHLYAFLKSPEGGAIPDDQISILIDDASTKKNILQEIGKTFSKADENDVIMLYMSGHGLDGSFVPYDFDGTNNLLAYEDMLEIIDASKARHKIYITDACHSGSMYATRAPYQMALTDFYSKFSKAQEELPSLPHLKR